MLETQVACSFDDEKKMVGDRLTALEINQSLGRAQADKVNLADLVAELIENHDFSNEVESALENHDFREIVEESMPDDMVNEERVQELIDEAINEAFDNLVITRN